MEYVIFYQGGEAGRLTLETEGLYYRLSAASLEPEPGIWRLWGCFGAQSRPVGVLAPGTGGLRLEKRVSRHSWPILPDCFVLGRAQEDFRPWRGILDGHEVPDGMLRENADGSQTLAIFAQAEGLLPLAEYVSLMEEGELGGRPCLFLPLPDGLPELPTEEQETQPEQEDEAQPEQEDEMQPEQEDERQPEREPEEVETAP